VVNGTPTTAQSFASDFCLPAKHAEAWEVSQAKVFGVVATGFRAFSRSVERLKMESGRKAILRWVSDPELRKRKNFGLEELNALVEEMERTKAGTVRSATVASDAADTPDSAPGKSEQDTSGDAANNEVDDGLLEECSEQASQGRVGSPVRKAARAGSSGVPSAGEQGRGGLPVGRLPCGSVGRRVRQAHTSGDRVSVTECAGLSGWEAPRLDHPSQPDCIPRLPPLCVSPDSLALSRLSSSDFGLILLAALCGTLVSGGCVQSSWGMSPRPTAPGITTAWRGSCGCQGLVPGRSRDGGHQHTHGV
jgi:hypothetical protein